MKVQRMETPWASKCYKTKKSRAYSVTMILELFQKRKKKMELRCGKTTGTLRLQLHKIVHKSKDNWVKRINNVGEPIDQFLALGLLLSKGDKAIVETLRIWIQSSSWVHGSHATMGIYRTLYCSMKIWIRLLSNVDPRNKFVKKSYTHWDE